MGRSESFNSVHAVPSATPSPPKTPLGTEADSSYDQLQDAQTPYTQYPQSSPSPSNGGQHQLCQVPTSFASQPSPPVSAAPPPEELATQQTQHASQQTAAVTATTQAQQAVTTAVATPQDLATQQTAKAPADPDPDMPPPATSGKMLKYKDGTYWRTPYCS